MREETAILDNYLKESRNIVLVGHFNPDGDAIGSTVGMYQFLRTRGRKATILFPTPVPSILEFILPTEEGSVRVFTEEGESAVRAVSCADLIICLDMSCIRRSEGLQDAIRASKARKVLIDHHIRVDEDNLDLVISTTEVSSTCELEFKILMDMPDIAGDVHRMSMECAVALYLGMMTDTNNFSNSVFPGTFEMASRMLERGVNTAFLQEKVMQSYPEGRLRLMGKMLSGNLTVMEKERTAYMVLTEKEKAEYGIKSGDTEGFVNIPLTMGKVVISALFTEDRDGGFIRVSLRSKGEMNVNLLAKRYFNGGGHRNASGGKLFIPVEDVPAYFENSLIEYLSGSE